MPSVPRAVGQEEKINGPLVFDSRLFFLVAAGFSVSPSGELDDFKLRGGNSIFCRSLTAHGSNRLIGFVTPGGR